MTLLSIGMIVKNEEAKLRETLEALRPLQEQLNAQLIIADTGSTDQTVAIAKEFTNEVFAIEWKNDFAAARNETLRRARGQWFFYLDADEVLENPEELIKFFKNSRQKEYNSMRLKIRNMVSKKRDVWQDFWTMRIFRVVKNSCFKGTLHEAPNCQPPFYTLQKTQLNHSGYNNDDVAFMQKKSERNITIMENMLAKDDLTPDERVKLLIDYGDSLKLGGVYSQEKLVQVLQEAIDLCEDIPLKEQRVQYLARAYSILMRSDCDKHEWQVCAKRADEYWQKQPRRGAWDLDIYGFEGIALYNLGEIEKSVERMVQYKELLTQDLSKADFVLASTGMQDFVLCVLGVCYYALGKNEQAWRIIQQFKENIVYGNIGVGLCRVQLALSQDVEKRLPEVLENFGEEILDTVITEAKRLLKEIDDFRKIEIASGLALAARKISPTAAAALQIVRALYAVSKSELEEFLQEIPQGQQFPSDEGGIIRQALILNADMTLLLPHLDLINISLYLAECDKYFTDMAELSCHYYNRRQPQELDLPEHYLAQYILCYYLVAQPLPEELRQKYWTLTVDYAYSYMQRIYQLDSLNYWRQVLTPLEQFIWLAHEGLMSKAAGDLVAYMRFLRQGVAVYPMAKDIVAAEAADIERQTQSAGDEFAQLTSIVKTQIAQFIEAGQSQNAVALLAELAELLPQDDDVKRWQEMLAL